VTTLAVVAFPKLSPADYEWVEAIRARHDPQAPRIRAHLTLVFPADLSADSVAGHVAVVARRGGPVAFTARGVRAHREDPGDPYLFLVPDEGHDEIAALHARLNEGPLRGHLRHDPPYLPHITIGRCGTFQECQRLADDLNREGRTIEGVVSTLELLDVGSVEIRSMATFPLLGGLVDGANRA
jgi:2'-5' RNA ligase